MGVEHIKSKMWRLINEIIRHLLICAINEIIAQTFQVCAPKILGSKLLHKRINIFSNLYPT